MEDKITAGLQVNKMTYNFKTLKKVYTYAKAHPDKKFTLPERITGNWHGNEFTGNSWLRWFRRKLQEKINRDLPPRGRKDSDEYHRDMKRAAKRLNTAYTCYSSEPLPQELEKRFAYKIDVDEGVGAYNTYTKSYLMLKSVREYNPALWQEWRRRFFIEKIITSLTEVK